MTGSDPQPSTHMTLDDAAITSVLETIIQLMETKCIRLNGSRPDWRALFSAADADIRRAESQRDFEARVSAVLAGGGLSHVAFFHETGQRAPARYAINATFFSDGSAQPRWVFQDVHEGGPAHGAGLRPGDVLLEVDGQPVGPPELPTFSLGVDAVLTIEDARGEVRQITVVLPKADPRRRRSGAPPMAEPTSVTARMLDDGIGYLRMAFFPGANGQRFARELDQRLASIPNCSRLIVDLRGNLGGFVGSLRLMSYLTPERMPVGYSLTRRGEDRGLRPEQLPCIDRLPASTLDMPTMAFRFKVLHRDLHPLGYRGARTEAIPRPRRHVGERAHGQRWRNDCRFRRRESPRHARRHSNRRPGPRWRQLRRRSRFCSSASSRRLVHLARHDRRGSRGVARRPSTSVGQRTSGGRGLSASTGNSESALAPGPRANTKPSPVSIRSLNRGVPDPFHIEFRR